MFYPTFELYPYPYNVFADMYGYEHSKVFNCHVCKRLRDLLETGGNNIYNQTCNKRYNRKTLVPPQRYLHIVLLRYRDHLTYKEIAQIYGLSQTRIQQIENKCFRRLRHVFYKRYLGLEIYFEHMDHYIPINLYPYALKEYRTYSTDEVLTDLVTYGPNGSCDFSKISNYLSAISDQLNAK